MPRLDLITGDRISYHDWDTLALITGDRISYHDCDTLALITGDRISYHDTAAKTVNAWQNPDIASPVMSCFKALLSLVYFWVSRQHTSVLTKEVF